MGQIDPFLVFTPLNHKNIAQSIKTFYQQPMKRSKDPRIIQINNKYLIFTSVLFSEFEKNSTRSYIKDLLSYQPSTLNLTKHFSSQKKRKNNSTNMMFSHIFSSYDESSKFLIHLEKISKRYKQKLSFSLRFHSYNEVKRKKILFLFGLVNWSKDTFNWGDMINIEEHIPYLRSYKKQPLESTQTIKVKPNVIEPVQDSRLNQVKEPVFPYGKVVSEEDIKKLVKNIPPPPT
jgi:hypothetical protein